MAIYKNKASQKVGCYAYGGAGHASPGEPVTGDAANITAQISIDGGVTAATNDVNPTELDATDAKGIYLFDLTQAESNGDLLAIAPVSSTSDVLIEPLLIYTEPERRDVDDIGYDGAVHIDTVDGTAGTVDDVNGTKGNPVDSFADAKTIADSKGLKAFVVAQGSAITITQGGYAFRGHHWQATLSGTWTSSTRTTIKGASVGVSSSGTLAGAIILEITDSLIGSITTNNSLADFTFIRCGVTANLTLTASKTMFFDCYTQAVSAPTIDVSGPSNRLYMHPWSGDLNIDLSDTMNACVYGTGQVSIDAGSVGGTVFYSPEVLLTNNASGTVTATPVPDIDGKAWKEALQYIAATTSGKVSGAGTGTNTFVGLDGSTNRVESTVDASGNRTAVSLDP